MTRNATLDLSRHPCFNEDAKGVCGRVHLPIAPKCNLKCNYCNRKYDCVNESRPGVTSGVLSPAQAERYFRRVRQQDPRITVVGIAGPGDPFANPEETLETLERVRALSPHTLLCVSTNGLALPPHLERLANIGVSHVTVTVNAVNPEIGARLYSWVKDGNVLHRGVLGAKLLLERQLEGIRGLKERGLFVKVNSVVVPGVNDEHLEEVAATVSRLGADVMNCLGLIPTAGTPFEALPSPGHDELARLREATGTHLPQMKHCQRCRADAVGLLEEDRSDEFGPWLAECAETQELETAGRPYVAVATRGGGVVNEHLGEAAVLELWEQSSAGVRRVGTRPVPPDDGGLERWRALAVSLADCRAVLVSGAGPVPRAILAQAGVLPIELSGTVETAAKAVFAGGEFLEVPRRHLQGRCAKGAGCQGDGRGCG